MTENIPQITCSFPNESSLYLAYMPFVIDGGLFIRTNHSYPFGSEVELIITLMNEQAPYTVRGKIVWITPKGSQGSKFAGVGVQFVNDTKRILINKIETQLAGMLNSTQLTDTI